MPIQVKVGEFNLKNNKFTYIPNSEKRKTYETLNKYKYIFAIESTLAIENLVKYGRTGFFFNRPNIFPTKDIGLIRAISINYKKKYPPSKKFLNKLSKLHFGYRSVFLSLIHI